MRKIRLTLSGVPRSWHFPFHLSYWTGKSNKSSIDETPNETRKILHETPPNDAEIGVELINLTKIYKNGSCCSSGQKLAVDNLNLRFYQNQITSFLGHNGAGKTTTMSMMTGLYVPTSGTARIGTFDVHDQMDEIRKILGFCPQHNVLLEDLTCAEHIYFFATLKGQSKDKTEAEIDDFLSRCGLLAKRHMKVPTLSGGMKRKLSVALAFCGGSEVVLLDEPTAGVDPHARRGIWDLLLSFKENR